MRPLRAAPNGLLTTRELHDRRFDDKQIEAMVRWCWLVRLHRGVYFVPAPDVLSRAALTAAGDGGVLCDVSALGHLDLRPRCLGPLHVNRQGDRRKRDERIRIHRARIPGEDVAVVRGLQTTTPTRTLLDVARRQPRFELVRALEQAERLRMHVDRERLDRCPHLAEPLEIFDHYGVCTRSDAEAMFLFVCEDHAIERPMVNQPVGGCEADFHWPAAKLVVEVDGYEFHSGLPAFRGDRRRGGTFRRAGYEVVRIDADEVMHVPQQVAHTVLAARPELLRQSRQRKATPSSAGRATALGSRTSSTVQR